MPKDLSKNVVSPQIPGPQGPVGPQGQTGEGFSSSDIGVGPQGEQGPKGDTGFIEDIANDANDRVITAVGDGTVNAESNLTFDGSILTVTGLTASADVTVNDLTIGRGAGDMSSNTVLGRQALFSNTLGNYNVALGHQALFKNTVGKNNTALGFYPLYNNIDGDGNIANGYYALFANTGGDNNVALGNQALFSNIGGDENSALGSLAGKNGTTGSNNTYLGYNAQPSSATVSNEIVLGSSNVTAVRTDGTIYVAGLDIGGTTVTSTATELNIIDGSTSATSTTLADADKVVVNDHGTMKQVALTDFETYFETVLDTLGNVTSLGTLTSLTVDNVVIDGTTIGHTSDTDLITLTSGTLTVAGEVNATTLAGALTGDVTGTADVATVATTVTITDNENENESNAIIFTAGGDVDGGNLGLESDGTLTYNPSTGKVTATGFIGAVTGNVTGNASGTSATVTTAAQGNITSVGTLTALTMGGELSCVDNLVTRPKLKDYSETVKIHGTKSSSFNVDFEEGNVQSFTVGGALTVTVTNPPADTIAGAMTLIITNGASSTLTWDPQIDWPGGNAPALSSSGRDVISLLTIDAGTIIYGFVGGINFS
jgi:hypothetical protein